MRKYWTQSDQDMWGKIKKIPTTKLYKIIFEMAEENSDLEGAMIVNLIKKELGMRYRLPDAGSKKHLLESGVPPNEIIEAKV